ncbi:SDR family NAD(P)-dependent oxidoreductase [Demequina activiva]|uniref:Oxidoreductase n=1 Tax=Demequina activiva TaxID=1582364 RepID=A0A919UG38_9MICO|nr:SDR family oxidoreductase [Demequina activiva]GIG54432.1 oxidoreductase [Demequina activiva]
MDMQLNGASAFVSGSTQGIGYAIARGLAAEGARVILHGRAAARVEAAVDRLRADVPHAAVTGLPGDLGVDSDVDRLVPALGEVDILVNNVGEFGLREFSELTDDDWRRSLDINLMSGVRLSRAVLPGMLARGTGRILFVGTESALDVPADMLHYGVAKAGALALANGLAKLTRGTSVTVNTIVGGPTYSDGVAAVVRQLAQAQGMEESELQAAIIAQRGSSLLARFIEPGEIAALAVYLVSPLASATNGAAVRADGGVLTTTT